MNTEMKPEDVTRALELCNTPRSGVCKICPYHEFGASCHTKRNADALALLREKDAEIERLKNDLAISKKETKRYMTSHKQVRAEVITEFAERMEKTLTAQVNISSNEMLAACMWCLDLVKNVEKKLKGATDGKTDL